MDGSNPNESWPTKPLDQLVDELQGQERSWWAAGQRRGYWQLLRLMYAQSQGMDPSGAVNQTQQLTFVDRNKSFVRFRCQLARSHVKQRNIIAQGERITFQALALNSDFATQAQIPTAQSGIDYLWRATKGEHVFWQALESDGFFGEGFVWGRWDADGGDEIVKTEEQPVIDPTTGEQAIAPAHLAENPETGMTEVVPEEPLTEQVQKRVRAGTPKLQALYPWEVVRDPYAKNCPWVIVREVVSKYEIAAQYPELADKIMAVDNLRSEAGIAEMFAYDMGAANTDQIIVRHFYHEASAAVPGGRYVGVAGDIPLWDLPCPLSEGLPIISICSARYFGTQFGYPECADLLSLQEMIDELLTQGANNFLRYGNQSLWAEDGVEVDLKKLAQGGGFFNYKTGQKPPQTIAWAEFPQGAQSFLEFLIERMNEISGMNSVARGAPQGNIESGTFAALMLNIARKFVSSTEQTLQAGYEAGGNMLLQFLRANADTEFVGIIAGANQAPYLKTFTGTDFAGVKRVQVTTVNALLGTIPGRFEVFNAIAPLPPDERPAAVKLLTTGDPSGYTDDDQSETVLIQYENEQLMQGIWVEPAQSDDVKEHNKGHKAAFDKLRTMPQQPTPELEQARVNALGMLSQHMSKHGLVWALADPILLDSLGLPRAANIMAPGETLPTPPVLSDNPAAAGGGGAPAQPNGNLPPQPDPASAPEESGDFGAEAAE